MQGAARSRQVARRLFCAVADAFQAAQRRGAMLNCRAIQPGTWELT